VRSTFLLLVCIGLFSPQPAFSGDKLIFGAGTISCAEWQKYRLSDDKPNIYQAQARVDGYLSGYNVASEDADLLLSKPSGIALYAWIDNFCVARPLDALAAAVTSLRKELSARSKR
jgi:hypothetical protein